MIGGGGALSIFMVPLGILLNFISLFYPCLIPAETIITCRRQLKIMQKAKVTFRVSNFAKPFPFNTGSSFSHELYPLAPFTFFAK